MIYEIRPYGIGFELRDGNGKLRLIDDATAKPILEDMHTSDRIAVLYKAGVGCIVRSDAAYVLVEDLFAQRPRTTPQELRAAIYRGLVPHTLRHFDNAYWYEIKADALPNDYYDTEGVGQHGFGDEYFLPRD